MNATWVSLKEKVYCGNNTGDVVCRSRLLKSRSSSRSSIEHPPERDIAHQQSCMHNLYCELQAGNPSRNIVEKIFQASSASNHSKKINKVLRVNNSRDVLERFENYRENVKAVSRRQYKRHPRSTVDGNELLRFYGTTLTCCSGKAKEVSSICRNPTCRVCRLIQSGFSTLYNKLNGIKLSTSSEELSEQMAPITRGKDVKRAAILCRTIAGRVFDVDDGHEEDDDSDGDAPNSRLDVLTIRNPDAVLPCFIVIF